MNPILSVALWIAVVCVNIMMARLHSVLVKKAIATNTTTAILHGAWGFAYLGLTMIPLFFHWNSLKWTNALNGFSYGLLHASVFPFFYNGFRGLHEFNLSTTSKSLYDRILVKLKFKTAEMPIITTFCLSVFLEMFFILKSK